MKPGRIDREELFADAGPAPALFTAAMKPGRIDREESDEQREALGMAVMPQ